MGVSLFLIYLPALNFIVITVYTLLKSFWNTFVKEKTLIESDYNTISTLISKNTLYIFLLYIWIHPFYNFNKFQILFIGILFLGILSYLSLYPTNTDLGFFSNLTLIQGLILLTSENLLTIFFILELINSLILYTMLWAPRSSYETSTKTTYRIINSIIYQFILNFFSSIILYIALNQLIIITGSMSLSIFSIISNNDLLLFWTSILLFSFLLKLGTGPWIFFKINIYKNMNLILAMLYTIVYFTIILVFFISLFLKFGFLLTININLIFILLICFTAFSFLTLVFQTSNILIF